VVSWVSTPFATWSVLIALLSIHLATNYAAVKAVSMRCLNRQRANIVFSNTLQHGSVLSPAEVSQRERIFERDGVLRWADDRILGHCKIGGSLGALLSRLGKRHKRTGSLHLHGVKLSELISVFGNEAYMLWLDDSDGEATIVLKEGCTPVDQLKAWVHALLLAQRMRNGVSKDEREKDDTFSTQGGLAEMIRTLGEINEHFDKYAAILEVKGWDLNVAALETRAGSRAQITAPFKH
jgi:uncharacterized protein (UPF0128 family)